MFKHPLRKPAVMTIWLNCFLELCITCSFPTRDESRPHIREARGRSKVHALVGPMLLPYFSNLLWHHQVVPKDMYSSLSWAFISFFHCIPHMLLPYLFSCRVWGPWCVLDVGAIRTYHLTYELLKSATVLSTGCFGSKEKRFPTIAFLCFQESGLEHPWIL